jgi:hypothetical protein
MVVPAFPSFPLQQDRGFEYLDAAQRPPWSFPPASPTISSSSSDSSHNSHSARPAEPAFQDPEYAHQQPHSRSHSHSSSSSPPALLHRAGPGLGALHPPHQLTLPSIDELTMSAIISPHPGQEGPRMSMTSREWVIPPRPKPGRKPATDTPPTKRKAQNRAAQRAFRERRAARVSELEEQLDQQKEDYDKTEGELKEKIHGLELELQSFRSRCLLLENMLERERKERIRAETEADSHKRRQSEGYFRHGSTSGPPAATPMWSPTEQSHRRSLPDGRQSQHHDSFPPIVPSLEGNDIPLNCANCSPGACACADAVMKSLDSTDDLKRPASPSGLGPGEKRQRAQADHPTYTNQNHQQPHHPGVESLVDEHMSLKDGCGFCKEGTYCVCAETAMATPAMTPSDTLPPISHQTQTPPPSEPDIIPPQMAMEMTAEGAVKLPRRNPRQARAASNTPTSRGCGGKGPGTCAQCQADPKSGLFCRLMAAKLGGADGGCCGGKGADGGCCKSGGPKKSGITLPSLPSLGLSCAEAYQTLSSHRNFDKASDDIGSWLPKLRATPASDEQQPNKIMPMEVEAASIMSVLKDFDVRFGSAK